MSFRSVLLTRDDRSFVEELVFLFIGEFLETSFLLLEVPLYGYHLLARRMCTSPLNLALLRQLLHQQAENTPIPSSLP